MPRANAAEAMESAKLDAPQSARARTSPSEVPRGAAGAMFTHDLLRLTMMPKPTRPWSAAIALGSNDCCHELRMIRTPERHHDTCTIVAGYLLDCQSHRFVFPDEGPQFACAVAFRTLAGREKRPPDDDNLAGSASLAMGLLFTAREREAGIKGMPILDRAIPSHDFLSPRRTMGRGKSLAPTD